MKYFISDTHFGHYNVINYSDRPFVLSSDESITLPIRQKTLVKEMNSFMVSQWNSVVTDEDTVYFVGDFAFLGTKEMKEICSQLRGVKILIKGNHDRSDNQMKDVGFSEVYETLELTIGTHPVILSHYPYVDLEFQTIAKQRPHLIKFHDNGTVPQIPQGLDYNQMKSWLAKTLQSRINSKADGSKEAIVALQRLISKYIGTRLVNEGKILLHGHTHFKTKRFANMINCSVEAWNFIPASENQILDLIKEYEKELTGEGLNLETYNLPVYEYYRTILKNTPELKKMQPVAELVQTYNNYARSTQRGEIFKTLGVPQNYSSNWYELNKSLSGFISQDKLVDQNFYEGYCRNAQWAYWDATKGRFYHIRSKFGHEFIEEIECLENDKGFDVFIPYSLYVPTEQEREDFFKMFKAYSSRG